MKPTQSAVPAGMEPAAVVESEYHAPTVDGGLNPSDESVRFVRQVRTIVHDLIKPNPWIYWTDLLVTVAVAYVGFTLYTETALWSATFWLGFFAAGFAYYRATVFSHEITHFRAGTFRRFRLAWNALCGVPLMFPEFMYSDHKAHHVNHSYSTPHDSEYLPLARGTWRGLAFYIVQMMLVPVLGTVRFLFLAPLSWCIPSIRDRVLGMASPAVAVNLFCPMPVPEDPRERRSWVIQEVCCFAYGVGFLTLIYFGVMPWTILVKIYFLFLFVAAMNYARNLGAHKFLREGASATYLEQLLDSNTFPGRPVTTELWAPLGMRYHALHHLVPSMPYHNMGIAHRRLVRELPADSPYRATIRRGLWEAVAEVVRGAWRSGSAGPQPQVS